MVVVVASNATDSSRWRTPRSPGSSSGCCEGQAKFATRVLTNAVIVVACLGEHSLAPIGGAGSHRSSRRVHHLSAIMIINNKRRQKAQGQQSAKEFLQENNSNKHNASSSDLTPQERVLLLREMIEEYSVPDVDVQDDREGIYQGCS